MKKMIFKTILSLVLLFMAMILLIMRDDGEISVSASSDMKLKVRPVNVISMVREIIP